SEHEHRFSEHRRLLLQAARVSQDQIRVLHQIDKFPVVERWEQVYPLVSGEQLAHRDLDVGIQMDWIRNLKILVVIDKGPESAADPPDGFAEILAPVSGHEHEVTTSTCQRAGLRATPRGDPPHRIDDGVASQIDSPFGARALPTKVLGGSSRRREVQFSDLADDAAHELLRKRARADAGPKSSLHVGHGLLAKESRDGRGHRAGRVTLNDDHVWPFLIDHSSNSGNHRSHDVFRALIRAHHVEIMLGVKVEDLEDLVEHFAVLGGDADHRLNIRTIPKLEHQWGELHRLRARSKDDERFQTGRRPSSACRCGPEAPCSSTSEGAYSGTIARSPASIGFRSPVSATAASRRTEVRSA